MAVEGGLRPSNGLFSLFFPKLCASPLRASGCFGLVLIVSCVFHWSVFTSLIQPRDLSVATYFYIESAEAGAA